MIAWLKSFFQSKRGESRQGQAHITFGKTSAGRSITRATLVFKRQLWIWPIIAILILAVIGFGVRQAIERTMKENLQSELETLLGVERSMLEKWMKIQESNALTVANDSHIRKIIIDLIALRLHPKGNQFESQPIVGPTLAELISKLEKELEPAMAAHGFVGYDVVNKSMEVVAAHTPELIGTTVPQFESFLTRSLEGNTTVSAPFPSFVMLKDKSGRRRSGVPTMFVSAPVRDDNLQVIAVLALRIRPELEFTNILQLGRIGQTGETYAFNRDGTLVSNSRFDEELIMLGLLPDTDDAASILNISLRDPGQNISEGYRPRVRRSELPLCKPIIQALASGNGVDVEGYRSYRGVQAVGAWAWLPQYEIGIITEIDHAEAFRPLSILRWAFYSMFALLIASSIAIFIFTIVVARAQREAQKAAIEAKHLGQYRLEERLGAGAMGIVYKGHHAMLRRPTAIKLLNVDKVNETSIERFEREVQFTCKLNNPNTVAIYDYGRTPENVFYYAMEYLDGIDLQELIDRYGPQPESRAIHILCQICDSLYEAHTLGLVHRDIKPANIMLNRRGGKADIVKVLDFGLVKAIDEEKQARQSGGLAGTPLYMSPESIQAPNSVDARSDIYSVGAVGYFLITGQPVFTAASLAELCKQHVIATPDSMSDRLGRPISSSLEHAILACLEKNPAKRPQTARDLSAMLERIITSDKWTLDDAEGWWGRHERGQTVPNAERSVQPTSAKSGPQKDSSDANSISQMETNKASGFDRTLDH